MPDGRQTEVHIDVGKDLAKKSREMILSCEVLRTGKIAIYGRFQNMVEEDELCEICENGPSDFTPRDAVKKIIRELEKV